MQKNYKLAFNALKKIGCPVIEGGYNDEEHMFRISGEENHTVQWADYDHIIGDSVLDDFGVNHEINKILDKHGLFAEWQNPGVLSVCEI